MQAQVDYELIKRLDMRLAYRWYDVKTTYGDELLAKPFVATHRAFANLAYETRSNWKFDVTVNWQGQKRVPSTDANPVEYQRASKSPDFYLVNAQITKVWKEKFDVYLGTENLFNYKQENPIIAADNPFSESFDASLIWGPVMGRNVYLGIRYRIP
jgi:outer membrane receptor protein involved in Fe transport